jgi:hypothetical protein
VANVAADTLEPRRPGGAVRAPRHGVPAPLDLVGGAEGVASIRSGTPTFDIGAILKPKLTIQLAAGSPIVYAPYGDPGEGSLAPIIAVAGGLLYFVRDGSAEGGLDDRAASIRR